MKTSFRMKKTASGNLHTILLFALLFVFINLPACLAVPKVDLPEDLRNVEIPAENGRIMEFHAGSKPFTIFYIQDAHVNFEAQKNIAKIIEMLILKRGLRLVLVEGGIGDVSLTEYRVGPKEKRLEIAEQLMKEGKISGEEYLNFTEDYPLLLWGIESQVLYDENLIAYTKVQPLVPKTTEQLAQIGEAIMQLKRTIYPKAFFDFETKLEDLTLKNDLHQEATALLETANQLHVAMDDYPNINILSSLIDLEAAADFERVDYERTQVVRLFQRQVPSDRLKTVINQEKEVGDDPLKRADFYESLINLAKEFNIDISQYTALLTAVPYLRQQDKIDSLAFFDEKDKLMDAIADKALSAPDSKKLYQMGKDLKVLQLLVKLELVPELYSTFIDQRGRFKTAAWAPFLKEQAKVVNKTINLPKDLKGLDETIDEFQSFYRIANIRDQALVENLTEEIRKEREPESVLIAGGFHKDRLVRKLLRIGFNVVVISPNVGLDQGPELYRKMLTEKWENGRWYIKDSGQNSSEEQIPPQ
ncbi:MAG: hypothetical protein COV74_08960 [Candidatus Omnitrophica bacterium CG11_big_fil_rev_8_21_14_0_20_45_26]|uniref:Uncharacterized protein n=1 Tax=Candidatus Abzuiibacterium crystallinum TaxID=1974748 RepID=A0A2H0LLY5_9BACT|nr:MAG: hypothetical protein COV74_08960 [Candidatus Omnitrophica bacterium CG11_big_fil_rev_8_21_14_0_20_45_26]PIW64445.1 MAG: hypothetical protein COW12_06305 [Candidatus Omnitrophica bacterium CG12_big_fil_rev_8_21_14_0_65_45_16]